MDIEGEEHQSLIPFLQKYKVCQILLEVHGNAVTHARLPEDSIGCRNLCLKVCSADESGHLTRRVNT
ncbi:hypothetical protein TELCIR_13782 [Teladorsagia circumcincta]|uniref:Methyltransferase FkbM domain-containing protein n=1 Tax=Teladorsagia circumcincta TaxID=45464 RepID=A0A2G9U321_TELCI|nr:hypothetical protein TELCIR_13782 [Teladorsagia circumcincta]